MKPVNKNKHSPYTYNRGDNKVNTYKLDNGWTAETLMIDLETGKEVEMTKQIKEDITNKMFEANGYKVIKRLGKK